MTRPAVLSAGTDPDEQVDPRGPNLDGIRPLRDQLDDRLHQLLAGLDDPGEIPQMSCSQMLRPEAASPAAGLAPVALDDEEIR